MDKRSGSAVVTERKLVIPRLSVVYPQVGRSPYSIAQKVINQAILETVYALAREQGIAGDYTKKGTGTYEIKLNGKGLLSLTLDNFTYAEGAAHGLTLRKSLTADLESGKIYALEDFFLKGSDYRGVLSEEIKQQIRERDIPLTTPFERIGPNPDFYLTEKGLVLYFQQYEYTPYVWGFPEFLIPYSRLTGILDPKGPISRLVR